MVDALTKNGDEGRGMAAISLGEVPGNCYNPRSPNEETLLNKLQKLYYLIVQSIPREVKHFSTWRKRKKRSQEQYFLSSGERKGKSPNSTFQFR